MNNSKNLIQILKSELSRHGPAHNGSARVGRVPEWHCEPAQGRLTSLFKTWIQFLELFINLIQNACVFPNTILKHLYWSEVGFLVLLWSFFHLFTFLKSKQFQSEPAQGRLTCFLLKWEMKIHCEVSRPRADSLWKVEKNLQLEKKVFCWKIFFSSRFMNV